MRLNSLGQAAHGIGDGTVSVDGTAIAIGGGACWLDDHTVLYQRGPAPYVLEAYETRTKAKRVIDPHGANELAAGGGVWAAWGPAGVRTSHGGDPWKQAGLLDVSREGVLAICPDRQSGRGAELRGPSGSVMTVPECVANGVRLVGTALVWVQGGKVRAHGTAPSTIAAPNYTPVPVWAGNAWWLLYQDGERLLLQPWGEPIGYVVYDKPTTYSPDAIVLPSGKVRVAWCQTACEGPSSLRIRDLDLSAPRVRLDRPTAPPIPPPVEPPMPDYLAYVRQAREEYDHVPASVERGWLVTNRACELCGENFGLLSKPSGTNWNGYSIDCLMRATGETWDVLGDAEGIARPQWTRTTPTGMTAPSKWRPHVATTPPPTEPPPEPSPDDLEARVTRLEQFMASVKAS